VQISPLKTKMNLHYIFIQFVTYTSSIRRTNLLMLLREITALCSENHKECTKHYGGKRIAFTVRYRSSIYIKTTKKWQLWRLDIFFNI